MAEVCAVLCNLSTIATQISPAVGASVMHVHAVINAARYQAASQPATAIKNDIRLDVFVTWLNQTRDAYPSNAITKPDR